MPKRRKSFPELLDWDPPLQGELVDHLSRFVKAVMAGRPGEVRPEPWASVVPAAFAGRPLLLTASHVLTNLGGRQMFLECPGRFRNIPLDESQVTLDEATDVAVVLLPEAALEWGLEFLELEIQRVPALREGEIEIFLAMGFPARETSYEADTETVSLKMVTYRALEHPDAYKSLNLPRSKYVLTRFDRKQAYHKGVVRAMKLPHGMSGGGLWRFWGPDNEAPSPARGAFAGILTAYRESPVKCMISASVEVLQELASRVT